MYVFSGFICIESKREASSVAEEGKLKNGSPAIELQH